MRPPIRLASHGRQEARPGPSEPPGQQTTAPRQALEPSGGFPEGLSDPIGEDSPEGLRYVFEVTKHEVDTQFRIAERIDAKARGLFTLTAAIFAAAQALALREDVLNDLGAKRDDVVTIAIVAGALVGLALVATAVATFVTKDKSVESDSLFGWLGELHARSKNELEIAYDVVEAYISLMHRRQEQNVKRARRLIVVQVLCLSAIGVSVLQLIIALDGLT